MCQQCVAWGQRVGVTSLVRSHFHAPLSKATKLAVWERDRHVCQYCDIAVPFEKASIDHVLPINRGGTDDIANLALSCWPCNLGKGNRDKPDIERLAERRQSKVDVRRHGPDDLFWEHEIIWLRNIGGMPYLREAVVLESYKTNKPRGYQVLIGYAILGRFAPKRGHSWPRRIWLLHKQEAERGDFYGAGYPCEGVKPSSIRIGVPSVGGRD